MRRTITASRADAPFSRFAEKFQWFYTVSAFPLGPQVALNLDSNLSGHRIWIAFGSYGYPSATVNPRWDCDGVLSFSLRGSTVLELPLTNCHPVNGRVAFSFATDPIQMGDDGVSPAMFIRADSSLTESGQLLVPCYPLNLQCDKLSLSVTRFAQSGASGSWLFGVRVISDNSN